MYFRGIEASAYTLAVSWLKIVGLGSGLAILSHETATLPLKPVSTVYSCHQSLALVASVNSVN